MVYSSTDSFFLTSKTVLPVPYIFWQLSKEHRLVPGQDWVPQFLTGAHDMFLKFVTRFAERAVLLPGLVAHGHSYLKGHV